jgi:Fe-S cluster biogenesis protein NfuA
VLEPQIYQKIEQQVKDIYALLQEGGSEGKMSNSSIVTLLNEIEKDIDRYLLEFKKVEEKFNDVVTAETTKIKKQ